MVERSALKAACYHSHLEDELARQKVQNARIHDFCETQRKRLALQRDAMRRQQNAPNKPRQDANQLAKYIVDVTSGETKKIDPA